MGFEAHITIEILLQSVSIQITNNPVGKVKAILVAIMVFLSQLTIMKHRLYNSSGWVLIFVNSCDFVITA